MTDTYVAQTYVCGCPRSPCLSRFWPPWAGAWIVFNVSGGKDSSAAMFTTNIVLDQLG